MGIPIFRDLASCPRGGRWRTSLPGLTDRNRSEPGVEQTVPISLVQVLSYQHNHNSNIKDCIDCVLCSTGLS